MSEINLTKTIAPRTYRGIGQRMRGISTLDVPIGARCAQSVLAVTGGSLWQAGRIRLDNAFVVHRPPLWLLYVRHDYSGYARAAGKVFNPCDWKVDYDHALGSNIARQLGFRYVLLIRLTKKANRSHGSFERRCIISSTRRSVCFADRRIADKWIGRRATLTNRKDPLADYSADVDEAFGYTLKQMGQWAYAMGLEEEGVVPPNVRRVSQNGNRQRR